MSPGLFRILLAFIVVVHHSFPLRLGGWAVGMFFALSGFWISRMWRQKYSKLSSPMATFLVSRWWRLAPIFLVVNMITALLVACDLPICHSQPIYDWKWWATQPLVAGSTQFGRLLPPAWSLDVEMQFYLCAPLLIATMAYFSIRSVVIILVAMISWTTIRFMTGAPQDQASLDLHIWIFLSGCAYERFDIRPSVAVALISSGLLAAILSLTFAFPATRELVWQRGTESVVVLQAASIAFFILTVNVAMPLAMHTVHRPSGKLDRWLGDLSYPIYMFHWLPREWYYLHVDWTQPAWRNGLMLIANFAATTVAAILLLHLVDRPAQKFRVDWLRRRENRRSESMNEMYTHA